jgi:hypothetical protein
MPVKSKMITVTSRGYVYTSRGRVFAPILSPYREETSVIFQMLTKDGANIVEHLPGGQKIELTIQNFDRDNSIMPTPVVAEEPKKEEVAEIPPVDGIGPETEIETDNIIEASDDSMNEDVIETDNDDVADDETEIEDSTDGQTTDNSVESTNQSGNQNNRQRHKKNRH